MLGILRNITGNQKLLTSRLYDEKAFYRAFLQDIRNARRRVVIESPYLTEYRARYFMPLFEQLQRRKIEIQINTRHPELHDPTMRAKAERALHILATGHVRVYTHYDQRHWKLATIDNTILWEGSLNILSHARSKEVMRRTDSPHLCRQMLGFIKGSR